MSQSHPTAVRAHDVVLYGATGFVGRQTAHYFAGHADVQSRGVRWAIAGRSAEKLAALRSELGLPELPLVVADAMDEAAIDALARSTRVVLTTAGPFARYGSALLAACARHGTHYVDITGETPWVHAMMQAHGATAEKSGARIIPFCGFDSIPSDMSAWMAQRTMHERHGVDCVQVKSAFRLRGGLNGGTLASLLTMIEQGQQRAMGNPFLLNPAGTAPKHAARHADPRGPLRDADFNAWLAPFVMGPVNTRVVRRSAVLNNYGPDFSYQEYLMLGAGPGALGAGMGMSAVGLLLPLALKAAPLRALAARMVPPGDGPSEAVMDGGSYRCRWIAKSANGHTLRGEISDRGDPGNRATTRMLCESALALALQEKELPNAAQLGGFWTPSSGLGEVLLQRLRTAGMQFTVND